MAGRIVGLDIGRSAIKAVVIDATFRSFELVGVYEEPIEPEPEELDDDDLMEVGEDGEAVGEEEPEKVADDQDLTPLSANTLLALRALGDRGVLAGDMVVTHLDSGVYLTRIGLPFTGSREIAQVLGPQLDGRLPEDVDDLLLDFMVGRQRPSGENVIQVAAVRPVRMAGYLGALESMDVDPRIVDLAPFHLYTASQYLAAGTPGPVAVVDIGAKETNVLVYDGEDIHFARSFPAGGDAIVDELAETFGLEREVARNGMHREAFVDAGAAEHVPDGRTGQDAIDISNATRRGLKPIIRQLRRTLHAHLQEAGTPAQTLFICGGPSRISGLVEYIGQSLGMPAHRFSFDHSDFAAVDGFAEVGHRYVGALGLALRGVGSQVASSFNLRRGPFAFTGGYEFLRQRMPSILGGLAALVVVALLAVFARVSLLKAESNQLRDVLRDTTEQIFDRPIEAPDQIIARLEQGDTEGGSLIPEVSAYDLLVEISMVIGDLQDEEREVRARSVEVNMERGTFELNGLADTAETIDALQTRLAAVECMREIVREEIERVRGEDTFEYGLSGVANCAPPGAEDE